MHLMIALALTMASQSSAKDVDPDNLRIGRSGTDIVQPGQIFDLRANSPATLADLAKAARGKRFVFLGEQHATTPHQKMEADVIDALCAEGRDVAVGLEMYTRPKQDVLDTWPTGSLTEEQFLEQSDWKHQWGYDFGFYRPVFSAVREHRLPIIALNVPREWVHDVARGGYAALPISAKLQLPKELFLANRQHREVFDALMGGHQMSGGSMDSMYAAQVLWDEGMADTAMKYLERAPMTPKSVFVVIAGSGHVMYGQGINYRIARHHGGSGITMVMISSDKPVEISRGLADFVYVAPTTPASNPGTQIQR